MRGRPESANSRRMPLRRAVAEDLPGYDDSESLHRRNVCQVCHWPVEMVRGRHRPRRRPPPPPTHRWGAGGVAGRSESAGSCRSSPCRCAEASGPPIGLRYVIGCRYTIGLWSWCGGGIALGVAPLLLRLTSGERGGCGASRERGLASEFAVPLRRACGGLSRDGGAGALALSRRGVVLAGARASRAPPPSASAPSSASIAAPAACAPAFTPPPAAQGTERGGVREPR